MNLQISAKPARRELRGGLAGFRMLIACLALGVAAIAPVGSIKIGIEAGLKAESATLLGGDAEAEFTYRFAADNEREWLERISLKISEVADFRSMIVVQRDDVTERALTQIKAVDQNYPLSGDVLLKNGLEFSAALAKKDGLDGAAMEPVLADRLGIFSRLGRRRCDWALNYQNRHKTFYISLRLEPDRQRAINRVFQCNKKSILHGCTATIRIKE